jgi:D-alanyl-lipoteichoic acid acyltransferase DltB (MBOAT superfamily)
MQFNSFSYLLLLLIAVPAFWILPVRFRRAYILTLSFAFYATWNVYFIILPVIFCGIAFWSGNKIRGGRSGGRRALWGGIGLIVVILSVFKYGRFAVENLSALGNWLGFEPLTIAWRLALPLGISFYSFEAISYLFDTRQGRVKSASFGDLALFIMFWPHLVAGPIVRTRELIPQLKFDKPFESRFVFAGLDRLLLGLVQKNVIANTLGSWVDDGFIPQVAALNTTIDNWALAVAFGIQIYFDFAAYSNMAIGAAQLIGITLPENFRFPYHAANPADFWSRWHMTLSRWIRDYVFFPINAGFQDKKLRLYLSLVAVMGVVGLWHGAGWGFILWGLMHGVYLAAYRAFEAWRGEGSPPRLALRIVWRLLTLVAIVAAWVPFRAVSIGQAMTMLGTMFGHFVFGFSYSVNFYLMVLLWCGWILLEPTFSKMLIRLGEPDKPGVLGALNGSVLRPVAYASLLLLFLAFDDRDTQFIYFQF